MSRYVSYQHYKPTSIEWLGSVPSHWRLRRIKEGAQLRVGFPFDSKKFDPVKGFPLVRIRDIQSKETQVFYDGEIPNEALISDGDILVGMDGDFNVALWKGGQAALNQRVACVSHESYSVNKFLYYSLPFNMKVVNDLTYFTTVKHLSNTDILKTIYGLPSDDELQKIVEFLDQETAKIDALIEKQQQLIKLLKEKRQAVISHAVTKGLDPQAPMKDSGVEWLGEVPRNWSVAKIDYRYEILLGKMLDDKKITGNFLGQYLRNTDVQWNNINTVDLPRMDFRPDERDRYSVRKGDLLVCEGGEIGRCAIWDYDETCFYQKALHRLRPRSTEKDFTRYMLYLLNDAVYQERFISATGNATIAHLPAETFKQYRFAFPPLEMQVRIVKYLDQIKEKYEKLEDMAMQQISLLKERRTALISAAVTGKIDVRNWQPEQSQPSMEATA